MIEFDANELKNARVLITGGSGFLGIRLIQALQALGVQEIISIHRGHKPYQDRQGLMNLVCDMSQKESVHMARRAGRVDFVFNLAGMIDQRMPCPDPEELWNANVISLVHLTSAIDWSSVKGSVHMGTTAEYGNQDVPFREHQLVRPTNAYGWSKAASTQYAIMMTQGGYAKWCVARQFTGYGPGHATGFVLNLIRALKRGEKFDASPSSVTRDFIFVDDTIEGILRLALCAPAAGEIVNLCSGKEISLGEIAALAHSIIGKGNIIFAGRPARKGDFLRSWGDTEKIERLTGWKPHTSLEDGLRLTIPTVAP